MKIIFQWILAFVLPYFVIYLIAGDIVFLFLKSFYIGWLYCFPYIFKMGVFQSAFSILFFLILIFFLIKKGKDNNKKFYGKLLISLSFFVYCCFGFMCLGFHI